MLARSPVPFNQLFEGATVTTEDTESTERVREKDPFTGKVGGIHKAQLLTYMKLSEIATGLLINFNVQRPTDGIQRFKL